MFEIEDHGAASSGSVEQARIKVVGVGGAGNNIINNMIASSIKSVEFVAVNTDAQALTSSMAHTKVQIGKGITRGLGAGAKPEIGRDSAIEDKADIAEALQGSDMVFVTAGMGGGTGTGAAPVIAEIARGMGALTVAVVTKPFFYEGGKRKANCEYGLAELKDKVDTLIIIPNDKISMVVEKGTPMLQSFAVANDVLRHCVQGISDLILVQGLINLDFADVRAVMQCAGRAVTGMGAAKGVGAANEAAKKAVSNPLLENNSIEGATGVLINITGGLGLSLDDVQEASAPIFEAADPDANIIIGAVIDPDLKDDIRVTVIATGFKHQAASLRVLEPVRAIEAEIRKSDWIAPAPMVKEPLSLRGSDRLLAKDIALSAASAAAVRREPIQINKQTFAANPIEAQVLKQAAGQA